MVSSTKLWWRWVTYNQEPWAKVWHKKYVEEWEKEENLIWFSEEILGSHIWKMAKQGGRMVQDNSFWEVRNGKRAYMW